MSNKLYRQKGREYMLKVDFHEIGQIKDEDLKFAVIASKYQNKWIYVRHNERDTWEIPGGHREKNEDINDTAKRELFEETGAKEFIIKPVCDYSVTKDSISSYGRLFYGEVTALGKLPNLEIEEIDLFDNIPEKLTYYQIQPHLFDKILEWKKENK